MRTLVRLFIPAAICLLLFSCQKQNSITPPPVVNQNQDSLSGDSAKYYLAAFDERSDDSSFINYAGFEYDGSGRIIRCYAYNNSSTRFTVTYNGNEAMMLLNIPDMGIPGISIEDTIRFTLDADNKALKKIHYHHMRDDGSSGSQPLEQFTYDTTEYEYDAADLLKREVVQTRDSSIWNVSGNINITNNYIARVSNYTVSDGNVMEKKSVWSENNQTVEKTTSFEYNNAYPNRARLSNPAILMELHMFYDWPMNNRYKNIPEKVVNKIVYTDAGGNVVNTIESTNTMSLIYDANGYLTYLTDPAFPSDIKFYFRYSK